MARSTVQLKIEKWIRQEKLPKVFGQVFRSASLRLKPGGTFNFDAVSADNSIVANISTSSAKTARGKRAVGKIMKIRADMLFLVMAQAEKRLIVLTERDMVDFWEAEKRAGRVPMEIEFLEIKLPTELSMALEKTKRIASDEVSPKNIADESNTMTGTTAIDGENDVLVSE
jgi:hypothetical protein